MNSEDGACLVARAIPLAESTKDLHIEAIAGQLDECAINDAKTAAKKETQDIEKKEQKCRNAKKLSGSVSPADFVTMQSLRSSALARKMNTTSKVSRDCRNLFADLMQDNSINQSNNATPIVIKSIDNFVKEMENKEVKSSKVCEKSEEAICEQEEGKEKEQLISRGPIRICSRASAVYQPYPMNEHGIAPRTCTNDLSSYNPNVYYCPNECGVNAPDYYWTNSCETISNSSTPDTVNNVENGCEHTNPGSEENQLPEALSDFILKYSRRYTPSPDALKTENLDPASMWYDSPNSITSIGTDDGSCNSPQSANCAPNGSPTAPRNGQTPYYQQNYGKFGLQKQASADSGFHGVTAIPTVHKNRPAKDRLRRLIQDTDMDEAWAWTCKCIQHHPNALTYQDADKDTLLHIVSQHKDLAKIYALVEQMMKIAVNAHEAPLFDIQNEKGQTPLFIAVEKNMNEVVDYLLEAGASPNTHRATNDKNSPLHYASSRGYTKIVQILCSFPHTNVNSLNGSGITPLLYAFRTHGLIDDEIQTAVSNIGVIQVLLKSGADPTISDSINGKNIIHVSIERGQPELIEILRVCVGENVLASVINKMDLFGKTPLQYLEKMDLKLSNEIKSRLRMTLITCGAKN